MYFSTEPQEIKNKIKELLSYKFKIFMISISKNIELEDSIELFFKIHGSYYKLIRKNFKQGTCFMPELKQYFAMQEMTDEKFNSEINELKNDEYYVCLMPKNNNLKNGEEHKGYQVKNENLFPNMEIIGDDTDVFIIEDIAIVLEDEYYFGFYYNPSLYEK